MKANPLAPQARAIFQARFDRLMEALEQEVLAVKQDFNSRNLPYSTGALTAIRSRTAAMVGRMGSVAVDSVISAHKAGEIRFSECLESQLLDAFEDCFSVGYTKVLAAREGNDQEVLRALSNKAMHQDGGIADEANRVKIESQAILRQYYQEVRSKQKGLLSYLGDLLRLVLPFLFRGH